MPAIHTIFQEADIFSAIDELRSIGASRYISLPQIVVVGDQSSGKSSLLEYISGVPFPKGQDICTTFATELVMETGETDGVSKPDSGDTESLKDAFSAEVTLEPADTRIQIPSVKEKEDVAEAILSIQSQYKKLDGDIQRVKLDVLLKIKLRNPSYPRLTLVDLPGYVHTTLVGQAESMVKDIRDLAERYISQSRSIILAVVPATSDLAGNVVLSIAKVHDPDGRQLQLTLGYHLTLNRSNADVTAGLSFGDQERKETEFFSRKAWMDIDRLDKGISGLREKLVNILRDHIRAELPTVKKEIKSQIDKCNSALESLGPMLPTTLEGKMANLMRCGYVPTVRAKLQELGESFSETMQKRVDEFVKALSNAYILKVIKETRGRELRGFMQYRPFEVLASRCVEGWRDEVENYIDSVFAELNKSLIEVVTEKVPELMRRPFEEACIEYLEAVKVVCTREADRILSSERRPLIYSKRFAEQFKEAKLKTIQEDIQKAVARSTGGVGHNNFLYSDQAIPFFMKMEDPSSEFAVLEMKRALSVYLKVAADRTVDSIGVHVIEMHVSIDGEDALRNAISAVKVDNIVENSGTVRKRTNLEAKKATLLLASKRLKTL
ncbi:P-loop containing nucleoside triphosphate hydrolase protein [Chytridium lagenaria]|nr:P-loop containing nucleoside triphosphate hydrolase protein [Chytridium lagenaria]